MIPSGAPPVFLSHGLWPPRRGGRNLSSIKAILLLLAILISTPASSQTSEGQIEQSFRAGQQALQRGDFTHAAEQFKNALALDPTLVEAEVNLGLAYQGLFEYDLAVRHLTKGLRQRPNLLGPTVIVGMDYLKLGSPEKSVPYLQRALTLDPSNGDARQALASAYLGQENFRSAAEEFRQMAVLDSDKSEAWFKLGHEYLDLAARLAYRGAHLYRESAWGHRFLGDLLLQRGRWEDALKEYQKALKADPRQSGLHTSLGQTYLHAGKLQEAEAEFQLELQLDSRNELALLGLANLELAQGRTTGALEFLQNLWDASPEFLSVQREFPSIEVPPASTSALLSRVQSEPEEPSKHFLLAALYAAKKETSASDREWTFFQTDFLAWQKGTNAAATSAGDQGACKGHRYSRCVNSLRARKHLSDSERLLLGKSYLALQENEFAADTLAQVQGATGENAEASYWLARAYQALGAESYAQLEDSFPNSWRTHQLRAQGFALRQNLDDAVKEYQAAMQVRPGEAELHEELGQLYLDNHSDQDAQTELERALALDPSRTRALYLVGRLYVQNRENEKALPYLQRALRLQPDMVDASELLGTAYVRLGQFANAIPKLEKAAPLDHYGNVHYQLFLAYKKLGQTELAQKAFARSQDLRRSSLERDQALILGSPQVDSEPQ
jgi:tetratricopeptide (TPR) repeat protein